MCAEEKANTAEVLVVGVGNELCCDDGVGVHAVRLLEREALPGGVAVVDAGCALMDALLPLSAPRHLIVVDAVSGGEAPGTVYLIPGGELDGLCTPGAGYSLTLSTTPSNSTSG